MGESKTNCCICNIEINGEYCHQCGQRNTKKKLTFLSIIHELVSNIFNLEKSGLATFLLILKDPRIVVENYWNGYRNYYTPPSKFIVYILIVLGIHITKSDDLILGLMLADAPKLLFIILPVLFLMSSYFTFIRQKKTLIEHIIAVIYVFSTWGVIIILSYEAYLLFSPTLEYYYDISVFLPAFSLMLLTFIWNSRIFTSTPSVLRIALNTIFQLLLFLIFLFLTVIGFVEYFDLEIVL